MRVLVERTIDEQGRPTPRGRRVTVNAAESPLAWLATRGMLTVAQFDAGERLRADYERAQLAPAVTMRWAGPVGRGGWC